MLQLTSSNKLRASKDFILTALSFTIIDSNWCAMQWIRSRLMIHGRLASGSLK